jgi:hypothetical protein
LIERARASTFGRMKRFVSVVVGNHQIVHGYTPDNTEIIEKVEAPRAKKLIAVDRILSVSEKFILTGYTAGRIVYWEYEGGLAALEPQLMG